MRQRPGSMMSSSKSHAIWTLGLLIWRPGFRTQLMNCSTSMYPFLALSTPLSRKKRSIMATLTKFALLRAKVRPSSMRIAHRTHLNLMACLSTTWQATRQRFAKHKQQSATNFWANLRTETALTHHFPTGFKHSRKTCKSRLRPFATRYESKRQTSKLSKKRCEPR